MSYVGTARKQGYNAYEAIKNAISGSPDFIFEQGGSEQLHFLIDCKVEGMNLFNALMTFLKRLARLWPCYVICISVTYTASHIWNLPERTVSFKDYILNLFMINRFLRTAYMDGAHWYLGVLLSVTAIVLIYSVLRIQGMWITYVVWLLVELFIDKFTPFADMYILGASCIIQI